MGAGDLLGRHRFTLTIRCDRTCMRNAGDRCAMQWQPAPAPPSTPQPAQRAAAARKGLQGRRLAVQQGRWRPPAQRWCSRRRSWRWRSTTGPLLRCTPRYCAGPGPHCHKVMFLKGCLPRKVAALHNWPFPVMHAELLRWIGLRSRQLICLKIKLLRAHPESAVLPAAFPPCYLHHGQQRLTDAMQKIALSLGENLFAWSAGTDRGRAPQRLFGREADNQHTEQLLYLNISWCHNAGIASGTAPQRLFGREADNQHTEPLGVAALAAKSLRQLLSPPSPPAEGASAATNANGGGAPMVAAAGADADDGLKRTAQAWAVSALQVRLAAACLFASLKLRVWQSAFLYGR